LIRHRGWGEEQRGKGSGQADEERGAPHGPNSPAALPAVEAAGALSPLGSGTATGCGGGGLYSAPPLEDSGTGAETGSGVDSASLGVGFGSGSGSGTGAGLTGTSGVDTAKGAIGSTL
jgi:hypothetical protein